MPVAKPPTLPRWLNNTTAVDPSRIVEPLEGKKDVGWAPDERPPPQYMNWWMRWVFRWCEWLNDLTNQALNWAALHTFASSIVVNAPEDNDAGTFVGNGAGYGVNATGGENAAGVYGAGGGPNQVGVLGTGGVAGSGVLGQGGAGTAIGVQGVGSVNGAGVRGDGGASDGPGVAGYGGGGGVGALLQGGPGGGLGALISAQAGNATGAEVYGHGTGVGVKAFGGAAGLEATGNGSGYDIISKSKGIQFAGTQPGATVDPGQNVAHATNQCKAWGYITTNGSGGSTWDGYNIASMVLAATHIDITFARAFANTNFAVVATTNNSAFGSFAEDVTQRTTTKVRLILYNSGGVAQSFSGAMQRFSLQAFGRQ